MCEIEVPERCQWYRMILGELARISDHLTCNGAMAMELGAFTPCLWMKRARGMIYDVMEEETGARLTHSFSRVGGSAMPPTPGFKVTTRARLQQILSCVREVEKLLFVNRIFMNRLEEIGVVSADDAVSLGWTGPCLRASGVPYDLRKAHPYLRYADVEFDVPIGSTGDALDRFIVRIEEMKQSARIVLQCCDRMPDSGPMNIDDSRVVLALPAGEVYSYTEAGNGELGFYVVSDGSGTPYRVRIRRPCPLTACPKNKNLPTFPPSC